MDTSSYWAQQRRLDDAEVVNISDTRRRIVTALVSQGALTVDEIHAAAGGGRRALGMHLRTLHHRGIVQGVSARRRRGRDPLHELYFLS